MLDAYTWQESLYHNRSDPPHTSASKRHKKLVIGNLALNTSIKSLTDMGTSEQTQRWVRLRQDVRKIQTNSSGRWES